MSAPPVPADEKTSKGIPTRRILFAALGVTACASLFEWASWRGYFDFRNLPPAPGAADAYRKSLARLDDPDQAAGQVIHIGHSTHLLSIAGVRMLTDPWFYDPAFGALSHQHGPAVAPKEIGRLDAILVTHDHADHFDERAIDQLDKNAAVLVATDRLAARSKAMGFSNVHVLRAYEEITIGKATIAAVPAIHDIYEIGFVIRGAGRSVYFAGDTRYQDAFAEIAERYTPQLGILPVDGTRLRGGDLHVMTPQDALRAASVLGVSHVMPTHAEAIFSDPIVKHFVATTVAEAPAKFGKLIAKGSSPITCELPRPGASFAVPSGNS